MSDFLWHKVSKEEQKRIKKEAKRIMDSFSEELVAVEHELTEGYAVKREKQLREEDKVVCDKQFRKIFFENTPKKSGDHIKAEKGKWI
jgi:Asp-tRNA(Asn)/Glu-tRNA(Gln) amidotransferase C subunit